MAYRILLADDSPMIRHLICSFIEKKTNWLVCGEAENGKEAIEKVKELKPDVVILDLSMPVMNGLEAARNIAQIAPTIPLLMFTMHSNEQLVEVAQAAGIKDVISKTSGAPENIISAIRNILGASGTPEVARSDIPQ